MYPFALILNSTSEGSSNSSKAYESSSQKKINEQVRAQEQIIRTMGNEVTATLNQDFSPR